MFYRSNNMINMLIIQSIGAIGYLTLALSYFKKKKKDILLIEIISYIFFSIHFYLLNGITGAICNLIGLFALIVIYLSDKYKLHKNYLISIIRSGPLWESLWTSWSCTLSGSRSAFPLSPSARPPQRFTTHF